MKVHLSRYGKFIAVAIMLFGVGIALPIWFGGASSRAKNRTAQTASPSAIGGKSEPGGHAASSPAVSTGSSQAPTGAVASVKRPNVFGLSGAVHLEDVPAGRFHNELARLVPAARHSALDKLGRLQVPLNDVASLGVDPDGQLFYQCAMPKLPPPPFVTAADQGEAQTESPGALDKGVAAAAVSIETPPARHSRPGAAKVIYLDFNGHSISGTAWNNQRGVEGDSDYRPAVATYVARPFDTDGNAATFSDSEQTAIVQVWERVAEDYRGFDVDVTTEEPAGFTANTGRVLITNNFDANGVSMPASTAAGVAYLDVFGLFNYVSRYSPALVYANQVSNREDYIAEIASHEMGHNLSLSHDGTQAVAGDNYYGGHGSGETSWNTLMGSASLRNKTQWSKGEYYDADNFQDDLAIIASHLDYIPDDHADSNATATPLTVNGLTVSGTGIISQPDDADRFSFESGPGVIAFSVTGFRSAVHSHGGNLDVALELYDANGTVMASANIYGAVNATLNTTVTGGTYYLRVLGAGSDSPLNNPPTGYTNYGSLGTYTISGTIVSSAPVAPSITSQPANQIVYAGQSARFSASANGYPAPTFQWQLLSAGSATWVNLSDTGPYSGATATTLDISATVLGMSGDQFRCVVTNSVGFASSSIVTLTVAPTVMPSFSSEPSSQAVYEGTPVTFTAAAGGSPAATYQWQKGGVNISGATTNSYSIASVTTGDAGNYTVIATNIAGSATSNIATLSVSAATPLSFTTQPVSQIITAGNALTFNVTVSGLPTPTYQWKKGGVSISGATGSSYTIASVAAGDAGSYTVVATNPAGPITSNVAVLTVQYAPSFTIQPFNQNVVSGVTVAFSAAASGVPAPTYQWRKNGMNIAGATGSSFVIGNAQAIDAGNYTVVATNSVGEITSNVATLSVAVAPVFTLQPASQTVTTGSPVTFSAVASGTPSPTYQWRKNGDVILYATQSTYTIGSVSAGAAGNYDVVAANTAGSVTSTVAVLTVRVGPSFTTQPLSQTVPAGIPVTFTAVASGIPAPNYQWQKGGVNISGATSSSYSIASVAAGDAGIYTVVATNPVGSVTSNPAVLSVSPANSLYFTTQPADTIVTKGQSVVLAALASGMPAPSYQWKKGGMNIGGATSNVYSITAVEVSDAGNYTVVATNSVQSLTSRVATLTVKEPNYVFVQYPGAIGFRSPRGVAVDGSGNVFVIDGPTIQKVTPGGVMTTFAGSADSTGTADGLGTAARFIIPNGLAVDGAGNVYVTDGNGGTVRKISPGGMVTTLAGSPGNFGSADGTGTAARFYGPTGVAVDGAGNVYVVDQGNSTIRKITPDGTVSTLAGTAGVRGSADGIGSAASFSYPAGVAVDGVGNVYVSDRYNFTIRKIAPGGIVTTLAGRAGVTGGTDGTGAVATFYYPDAMAVDAAANIYVTDFWGQIRKITPLGVVSTLSGAGGSINFYDPTGVAVDAAGKIYVALYGLHAIHWGAQAQPVLTSAATASGTIGQNFCYVVVFSGIQPGYSASGLPAGLSIDAVTGVISGIPTAFGNFSVTLTATTGAGGSNATLNLTIIPIIAPNNAIISIAVE